MTPWVTLLDDAAVRPEDVVPRVVLDVDEARGDDVAVGVDALFRARLVGSAPRGVMVAMRSPLMPTSPYIHGLPVPSTMRPFSITTS